MRSFFILAIFLLLSCQAVHSQSKPVIATKSTSRPYILPQMKIDDMRCRNQCLRQTQILAAHIVRSTFEGKAIQQRLDDLQKSKGRLLVHDLLDAAKLVHLQILLIFKLKSQNLPVSNQDKAILIGRLIRLSKFCTQVCDIASVRARINRVPKTSDNEY